MTALPGRRRQVVLASRPLGIPQAAHFSIAESALPALREGELLVRNEYLSVDPAMRGWVNAAANYSDPVAIGAVMRSFAAGTVLASRHPGYAEGDRVMGMLGWQDYAVSDGRDIRRKVREDDLPLSLSLGVLGLNGVTAYFALTEVGEPRPGDTVVVSTAAGSVGSAVGQIARYMGCRTVGIAGGAAKVEMCRSVFRFDEALDYRAADFEGAIPRACPGGVNVYFDNTSGPVTDAVMLHLARGARVVVCGTASVSSRGAVAFGAARRATPSQQGGAHAGLPRLGLRASLRGGGVSARSLGARRRDRGSRVDHRRPRVRGRRHRGALPEREHGQEAHPPAGRVTFLRDQCATSHRRPNSRGWCSM